MLETAPRPLSSSTLHAPPAQPSAVTGRAVVLSLVLAAFFGYCIPIIDFKFNNTYLGGMHMPIGAIVVVIGLLVINSLLSLLSVRATFARSEILTIYITCLFSTLLPGRGAENFFVPNMLSCFYFATRENKWMEFLQPYLKPWMTPAFSANGHYNSGLVEGWYTGLAPGQSIPWASWIVPLLAWSTLILAVQAMQACLAILLRAQWTEREALAFPLLRLPLEMTEDADTVRLSAGSHIGHFFRNPLVWIGFSISAFIGLINGLNLYFPDIPAIPMSLNTEQFFTEAPWNQISKFRMQIYPSVIGISYLLTSEVSFSLWFFHLFSKAQLLAAYVLGFPPAILDEPMWTRGYAKGLIGYQQVGAILAYVGLLLWLGREHWKHIVRRALGQTKAYESEAQEALSYPMAFWGFVATLGFVVVWTICSGVRWDIALLMWTFYLAVCLVLTRVVAEAGLLFVQTGWMPLGPLSFLLGTGPGRLVDTASIPAAAMISSSLMIDMRSLLMPSFLQGFKLAHEQRIAARPLLLLIAGCILVSYIVGLGVAVRLGYTEGALQLQKWWGTAGNSQPALMTVALAKGVETNYAANWFWVALGATATWGMMFARSRFTWFPFHPIGVVMCVPFAMHMLWLSIFLGWACKVIISRFGGNDAHRKAIPLFMGLVLGDIGIAMFWLIIDGWQGRIGHSLLPI